MKGVLICGGTGSRLKPLTDVTNKSLLPVYDKPLILYPLQVLLDAGITEIAVVTGTEHFEQIARFLGSGTKFGCSFAFKVQEKAGGIAQALGLAEEFAEGKPVCAILGDNLFLDPLAETIRNFTNGGHIFVKKVTDPERFGVAELDGYVVTSIEEKPARPRSDLAMTGCYLFDARCFDVIKSLRPSARGELEITDVCDWYRVRGELRATMLEDEWIDAGTFESLYRAATVVRERKNAK